MGSARMRRAIVRVSMAMSANAVHRRHALVMTGEVAGHRGGTVCGVAGAPRIAVRRLRPRHLGFAKQYGSDEKKDGRAHCCSLSPWQGRPDAVSAAWWRAIAHWRAAG